MSFTTQFAAWTVAIEEGIVPLSFVTTDVNIALANTPPDEARRTKRKFRKLWRKVYKQSQRNARGHYHEQLLVNQFGVGDVNRTAQQSRKRKQAVYSMLAHTKVTPLIRRMSGVTTFLG